MRVGSLWFQSDKGGETLHVKQTLVFLTRQMQGPASAETTKTKTLTCIRTIFMGL